MNDNQPLELYIFYNSEHARVAGFRDGRHVHYRWMRCWCLRDHEVDRLRGMFLCRVAVTDHARREAYGKPVEERKLDEALHLARTMLRAEPMIWMEL